MKTVAIPAILLLSSFAAEAQTSLQFVPTSGVAAQGVLPLSNGRAAVLGCDCLQTQTPLLSILDASGNQTASFESNALGSGNSNITAASVNAGGNIWIAGTTTSDDFPLVHPLSAFPTKAPYRETGFVAKLDPNLNILFSTFWGGAGVALQGSVPTSLALDSSGNAYVVGSTDDYQFPTTGPVFGSGSPGFAVNDEIYAAVSKISADGSALLYSRLYGESGSYCPGGELNCEGLTFGTFPSAIAVDANGDLTLAGTTNTAVPITASVYTTGGGAFIARISSDGSQLIWSTEIGTSSSSSFQITPSGVQSIALDGSGNVYIAGDAPVPVTATPGALQPTVPGFQSGTVGFVAKLSSDAMQLLFATNLGGKNGATLTGMALDPAGNLWIAGNTASPDFPGLTSVPSTGINFALELDAQGTTLRQIFGLVPGTVTQPPAFDSNGNLLLLGTGGNLLRVTTSTASTAPAVFALVNSAAPQATDGVGPGELATLYGIGLGPSTGVAALPDENGLYPTQLGGVSVEFNDVPAPLLYAGPNQINFQAPFSLRYLQYLTVVTPTGALAPILLPSVRSIGVFGVLNPDGSLNGASNPAASGSIVSLYATGLGAPTAQAQDGAVSPSAGSFFQNSAEVTWQGFPLPVLYAGSAPGSINGLDQINIQLPPGAQDPIVAVTMVGTPAVTSSPMKIYTQ